MKSVKNVEDKNEELVKAFGAANKFSKAAKSQSDFNYDSKYTFHKFYRDSEKFDKMVSLNTKRAELKELHKLVSDFKNHKPVTIETNNRKNRIMNNINQFYNK